MQKIYYNKKLSRNCSIQYINKDKIYSSKQILSNIPVRVELRDRVKLNADYKFNI